MVLALAVSALAVPALAVHYGASLEGSTFQIETNADIVYQSNANTTKDWANVTETFEEDQGSGSSDDSYSGGVKEDTTCPSATTGSIPNNKSDLRRFGLWVEPGSGPGDDGYLHLYWTRVSEPSGTTLMDFEFNQSQAACGQGPNVVRSTNDMLIEYSLTSGGASATMTIRRWTSAGAWGPATTFPANVATGTVNTEPITAGNSDGILPTGTTTQARTFGEASINLNSVFADDTCESFGSAMLKSRSSDSFTSQLKDYIEPVPMQLTNCGSLQIKKTDAGGSNLANAMFKVYQDNAPLGAPRTSADTLVATGTTPSVTECTTTASDGIGNCVYTNLPIGTSYWVVETAAPAGYQAITTESLVAISTSTRATSTWVNQPALGDVKVVKRDDAGNLMAGIRFTLTGTSTAGATVSRECTTGSNGECTITNVAVGTYTLAEDTSTVPAAYGTASSQSVTVVANTLVTKNFANPRLHKVVVIVCHQGTNTLAPSSVTLGTTHTTIGAAPTIAGASAADIEAALCGLQGFGGKGHETVSPSVDAGSAAHN